MIPHLEPTPICRLGKWNGLLVLSLVSGVLFHQTVSADKIKELRASGKFVALKKNEKITRTSKHPGAITYGDNAISVADTSSNVPEVIPVKNLANLIDDATFT